MQPLEPELISIFNSALSQRRPEEDNLLRAFKEFHKNQNLNALDAALMQFCELFDEFETELDLKDYPALLLCEYASDWVSTFLLVETIDDIDFLRRHFLALTIQGFMIDTQTVSITSVLQKSLFPTGMPTAAKVCQEVFRLLLSRTVPEPRTLSSITAALETSWDYNNSPLYLFRNALNGLYILKTQTILLPNERPRFFEAES